MTTKDYYLVGTIFVLLTCLSFVNSTISLLIALSLIMIQIFYLYRNIKAKLKAANEKSYFNYRQLESLFSLYNYLDIRKPLPGFRSWAISPDFANLLVSIIIERKPKVIVETGSGISTIIAGYCLKKAGGGKIISLEHLEEYVVKNKESVSIHGLEDFVEIIHAPLNDFKINGKTWLCYDYDVEEKIDLLVVDGPPGTIQKYARYPVLHYFYDKLSKDAMVILDDIIRDQEKEMARMWADEYSNMEYEYLELEKGAIIIKFKDNL